jgi:hypothetical protein
MTKMYKPRVYIAGPISKGDLVHNVKQSDDAFAKLVRAGFAPFNPMWSVFAGSVYRDVLEPDYGKTVRGIATTISGLDLTHEQWYGADLPWVEVAHAVLRLPGESRGADAEVQHAIENFILVFYDVDELIRTFRTGGIIS